MLSLGPDRMSRPPSQPEPTPEQAAFDMAVVRNSPLSVARPADIGSLPMARGRILRPVDGAILIENLQIPGRRVPIERGDQVEAYFVQTGEVYRFRARVLSMDTPVQLNDSMVVRGMKLTAPALVERGNRRRIYRQSFVSLRPAVEASVWAVPLDLLTPDQRALVVAEPPPEPELQAPAAGAEDDALPEEPAPGAIEGFRIERAERVIQGLAPHETLFEPVPGLTLGQVRAVTKTPPHWSGEVIDASEFGIGLRIARVIYSRLKVFQPLVVRFRLPGVRRPMEFLLEVRRVQGAGRSDARLGGTMLINPADAGEVGAVRDLAKYTLTLQRERAKRIRDAA
jgi:hypothetical protein